jgi:hypothetical protein
MKRSFASALIVALIALGVPVAPLAAAPQVTGAISGLAKEAGGQPAANVLVRLRNVDNGQVAGIVRTEPTGAFTFTNVPAGSYVIEIVDSANRVLAASAPIALAQKATMGGLIVTLPASEKAAAAVVAAAGGSVSSSAAAGGSFWSSGAAIAMLAAIGAEVFVGVLVADADTSPKK